MATAWRKHERCSWKVRTSLSAWRSWAIRSTSATPTAWLPSPYAAGASSITASGRKLVEFKPAGHWTRSLLPSPDKRKLYAGVGSFTNIAENGMEVEEGRAAIYELDLSSGSSRIFASGLRNAVGMAWEPETGALWTVVNERDGLGDETPPDYLTSVRDGGFYGWPYCYWGQTVDDRVPQDPAAVAKAITPDYALGGHTASLGLCWVPAGTLSGFPDGMAIGQHGSWNRSTLSGYKLVFVPFANGRPAGPPRDILSGFLAPDERESYGRPVGVAIGPDGRSLLMADDVGNVIWRVMAE
jgi:glucose/arabinose dehydrogenase